MLREGGGGDEEGDGGEEEGEGVWDGEMQGVEDVRGGGGGGSGGRVRGERGD